MDAMLDWTPSWARRLLAGGIAGVVAKTAVAPLDRVKLLRQCGTATPGASVVTTLKEIHTAEGFRGFYRGNGANALRLFPSKGLYFMAYEQYRGCLLRAAPSLGLAGGGGDGHPSQAVDILAGSAAGGTALLATYPLDLARARIGAGRGSDRPGVSRVLWSAFSNEGGLRGVYRGLSPSLAGVLPAAGLSFFVYESLKRRLLPEEYCEGRAKEKAACCAAFGAAAGLAGSTVTYPLDVVRRQMQIGGARPGTAAITGTLQGIGAIVRTQGPRQLFAGLGLAYVKAAPAAGIGFASYECMKALLKVPSRDSQR